MKKVKRLASLLLAMMLVLASLSLSAFAAENSNAEYGQIILEPGEGSSFLTKDGQPLESILLTLDGEEGYWYKIGERIDFVIEVEDGYNLLFETFENANGGGGVSYDEETGTYYGIVTAGENLIKTWTESDGTVIGKNALSSETDWEEKMFRLMGFASVAGGGNAADKYFEADEEAPVKTVYYFLNMTEELQAYVDEDGYVNMNYDQYMAIVNAYFADGPEMDEYLARREYMDEDTEQIYYYLGGFGDAWEWTLLNTNETEDGYEFQGLFCSGEVTDTTGLTEYEDYYNGLYIDSAVKLNVVYNEDHGWQIAAYTEMDYYKIEDYGDMGEVLYVYNEEKENFSDVYYLIDIAQPEADVSVVLREGTYETIDGMYCYSSDMTVAFDAVCGEGWTCQVELERIVNGEPMISTWADSGIIYGGGSVCITPVPWALFTIDAEHAEVEVVQGLVDMQDGTYAYNQTSVIELKITPDEGYEISEVASFIYDDYVVSGQYISASGTWVIYPEFRPSTILVTTKNITDEVFTLVSGDDSAETVTVKVAAEEAAQFEGLNLVVEELEMEVKESALNLINERLGVEEENVYILDIYFENADGEEVAVNATMVVTIPIPEGWDPAKVAVYYVNTETGELTDMNAVISEDGKTVSFVTNHFSHYALVQKEAANSAVNDAPKTGDAANVVIWCSVMAMTAAAIVLLAGKKKEQNI